MTLVGFWLLDLYVNWLWFGAVGYHDVYRMVLVTRLVQFLVGGVLIGGLLALNLSIAYRFRPLFVAMPPPEDPLADVRIGIMQRIRLMGIGIPVGVGLIAGLFAQQDWRSVHLFLQGTSFGIQDPEFGQDIAFYVFDLPFYEKLLGWVLGALVVSFVGAVVTHYLFGGLRLDQPGGPLTGAAAAHLGILAGVIGLLLGMEYFLDRYELLFSQRSELFTGATYTDLHAVLPAKIILALIAVICAIAFFAGAFLRNLALPAIATVLLIVSAILVGGLWPLLLQQFSVNPNANEREAPSIQRNIDATRQAYAITDEQVTYVDYFGEGASNAAQLADESATVSNIRLLDPSLLEQTFTQLQQRENFYGFPDELDVDRYPVDGEVQDYVVAVRELETASLAENQRSWINQHLRYTHGDGFVAARADRVNAAPQEAGDRSGGGYPVFTVSDTTRQGAIPVAQPRIYYGELIDSYVIVGGNPGDPPRELELDGLFTYDGAGGIPIGSWWRRLVFAAEYGERNILLNEAIGAESKIIFRQDPRQRVEAVAPWLTIDGDPYPAVVDGRIQWIVDGYTTLERYPYAQRTALSAATPVGPGGPTQQRDDQISYLRNSVKATVDAYDGTVVLYAFDEADPVLQTWMKVFPGTVAPASEISDELRRHFRYPQDLFMVQRQMLTRYHVDDPQVFFSTNDFWDVPTDPTDEQTQADQPPYYVLAGPPAGDGPATFQLTSALVGLRRQFLAAYVSASASPDRYGTITVLRLPTDSQALGPQQVQTRFRSSAEVSQELNLLQAAETTILFGNLLTLPTGDGTLLYVEPVYVQRINQEVSFPQLNRVLVLYGDRVGYAPTLDKALQEAVGAPPDAPLTPPGSEPPTAPPGQQASPEVEQAALAIAAALRQLQEAKAAGDFVAEGQALAALDAATRRFTELTGGP